MSRTEKDYLGERTLEDNLYYGIQTLRSTEILNVSGRSLVSYAPHLPYYLAMIKKASALAHMEEGDLERNIGEAICQAADEVMEGRYDDQFPVDSFTGGGGISIHMNINEVIANRANELLTGHKGYDMVHPNTHVNKGQSTNDVYPSAIELTLREMLLDLAIAAGMLERALLDKSREYADVVKLGRTCLQDALPLTWGQSLRGTAAGIGRQKGILIELAEECLELPLGGTAIGTGEGVTESCTNRTYAHLRQMTGWAVRKAENFFDSMQNGDMYPRISEGIKGLALCVSKFSGDLRILCSGPRAGLAELTLPLVMPGSSIMPGKINPILPELMKQIYFQIAGNDVAVTLGAEQGELELNVWEGIFLKCLMESGTLLRRGIDTFTKNCVQGIVINREHCLEEAKSSTALAAAVSAKLGYEEGAEVAREAVATGKTIEEVVIEKGLMDEETAEELLDPIRLTEQEG